MTSIASTLPMPCIARTPTWLDSHHKQAESLLNHNSTLHHTSLYAHTQHSIRLQSDPKQFVQATSHVAGKCPRHCC